MMASEKKKLKIKPFKAPNRVDETKAKEIWMKLSQAIEQIYNRNASSLSFEELYRNAYNLVLFKHSDMLYRELVRTIEEHLTLVADRVARTVDDQLLHVMNEEWMDHQMHTVMVRDIFMYMDRNYVRPTRKVPIYDRSLQIFRMKIIKHPAVNERMKQLLLDNVTQERNGQLIDRSLMKNSLSMLVNLGVGGVSVYEEDFERYFLDLTKRFYRDESQGFISSNSCQDYMKKAEERILQEQNRAAAYLDSVTEPKLLHIVETEWIANHAKVLVETDGACFLILTDAKDLKRMYDLFSRVPSTLEDLRATMADLIKKTGFEIVSNQSSNDAVIVIQDLLRLREKYCRIVHEALRDDCSSQRRLKESFEEFSNKDTKCASYLASYVDDLLKSKLKGVSESDVEVELSKVITLFRYLKDKDVFESFYKQNLAKRFMSGKTVSDEAERLMISKLKTECGYQFTTKLEGMFTDMKISENTMDDFRKTRKNHLNNMEIDVKVLTTGYWPITVTETSILPEEVQPAMCAFEDFYHSRHGGRRLLWQSHLGSADLRSTFGDRKHDVTVSTYQMSILMLFNERDQWSLSEIRSRTEIPEPELRRHLISLCTPRYRILTKSSKGKGMIENDVFFFNENFSCKLKRVKIPLVSMKETTTQEVQPAVPRMVEEDRRHLVEAAIVRTMKTRRSLSHNELVAEVIRQLSFRFVPSPVFIKNRIESLIEREYVERNVNDRKVYNYLA